MKAIEYKCGSCFHWEELAEQPKDAPPGRKIGICRGAPPSVLVVPVRLNQTQSGVILAKDEKQQAVQGAAMSQNQPLLMDTESGCARHQDACVMLALHTQQKVMEWMAQQQLLAMPPAGHS